VRDPDSVVHRVQTSLDEDQPAAGEVFLRLLSDETLWTLAPDRYPRPPGHDQFVAAVREAYHSTPDTLGNPLAPCGFTEHGPGDGFVWPDVAGAAAWRWATWPPIEPTTENGLEYADYYALRRKVNVIRQAALDECAERAGAGGTGPLFSSVLGPFHEAAEDRSFTGMGPAERRAFLALELNALLLQPSLYDSDAFTSVPLSSSVLAELERLRSTRSAWLRANAARARAEAEAGLLPATHALRLAEMRAFQALPPTRRSVQLNRALLDATFAPFLAPVDPARDARLRHLVVVALIWIVAGGVLGWLLGGLIRTGEPAGPGRSALVGALAALVAAPIGVTFYVLGVRLVALVADVITSPSAILTPPADVTALTFGHVVVARFAALQDVWVAALFIALVIVGVSAARLRRRAGLDRIRWLRHSLVGIGSVLVLYLLLDLNALFVAMIVAFVWLIPGIFLGAATPYLRTGSRLPPRWGWIALGLGVALVLLAPARMLLPTVPWWPPIPGAILILVGFVITRNSPVEDYWPLAALTLAVTAGGTTVLIQHATFHGVVADVHALTVPAAGQLRLWRSLPLRAQPSLPTLNGMYLERPGGETLIVKNPAWSVFGRNLDVYELEFEPQGTTGDDVLDYEVAFSEAEDRRRLRSERAEVAARLELALVGSIGFWLTIGLLAAWAGLLSQERARQKGETPAVS
jgi:hypothetical protein